MCKNRNAYTFKSIKTISQEIYRVNMFNAFNSENMCRLNIHTKGFWALFFFFVGSFTNAWAQHQEVPEKPHMWKGKSKSFYDTGAIAKAFQYGTLQGHFRYFFMNTYNQGTLTDYFANAGGGGIRYETAPYHGLQFAVSGFYIFNLHSSPLGVLDTQALIGNRYELGLFDLEDPENKKDLDRLEEFYLKYNFLKESYVTLGRQLVNTPFINLQDGRMRPTGVEGIWLNINDIPKTKIEGGYLWAVSPRSTVRWYYMGESLGLYGVGVTPEGKRSGYAGHTESHYVATLGVHRDIKTHRLHFWNFHADNLFNSSMVQSDFSFPLSVDAKKSFLLLGVQGIRQIAIGNGGNDTIGLRYIDPNSKSAVISTRIGYMDEVNRFTLNYTRITSEGRYLMPREWGRDPFYTFMPRERNEGMGDVHAIVAKYTRKLPVNHSQITGMLGHVKLPDIKNTALNKYGFPSYFQANIDVRHQFLGTWTGLEMQLMYVQKWGIANDYDNPRYQFNKVDVSNINFVVNYHF